MFVCMLFASVAKNTPAERSAGVVVELDYGLDQAIELVRPSGAPPVAQPPPRKPS